MKKILGVRLVEGTEIRCKSVVVAVGGKAVPQTGSTGDGYPWAERAGHTVTTLFPTEVPVLSKEDFIQNRELQGLALRDVAVSVLNKKRQNARYPSNGHALYTFWTKWTGSLTL